MKHLHLLPLAVVGLALVSRCKQPSDSPPVETSPPVAAKAFPLEVPPAFVKLELRGEGSEFLRAPAGTRVAATPEGFSLHGGEQFQLELITPAPPLPEVLRAQPSDAPVVLEASDLRIVGSGDRLAFAVVRELVPEWDETDRRRFLCQSPGFVSSSERKLFSREAVGQMVGACRSISLPPLE